MLNRVVLIGRLTRDPELRTTTTGKNVVSFSIAVQKRFKPQDGSPDADFFRVTAWGSTAEYVNNYLTKGRLVSVDGRIEQQKFTTKEGVERETLQIVADNVSGLDAPKYDGPGNPAAGATKAATTTKPPGGTTQLSDDEYDPFADE